MLRRPQNLVQRGVNAQLAGAKGQIVVCGIRIAAACEMGTVVFAGLVGGLDVGAQFFGCGIGHFVAHALRAPLKVGVNEHPQAVVELPQDVIPQ